MTLRELITTVTSKGFFSKTVTQLQVLHEDTNDIKQFIYKYGKVVDELLDLPGEDDTLHSLLIDECASVDGKSYISVTLHEKNGDDTYGVDFMDWNELIDLEIVDNISNELSAMLAHILYELTWWGYTRESINQQRAELENIKKDNIVPFDLSELDD